MATWMDRDPIYPRVEFARKRKVNVFTTKTSNSNAEIE